MVWFVQLPHRVLYFSPVYYFPRTPTYRRLPQKKQFSTTASASSTAPYPKPNFRMVKSDATNFPTQYSHSLLLLPLPYVLDDTVLIKTLATWNWTDRFL